MYNLRDLTLLTSLASMGGCGLAWLVRCGSVPESHAVYGIQGITWSSASL